MAKSLKIVIPDGQTNPAVVDKGVLSPSEAIGTLGAIVAAILAAEAEKVCVAIDFTARQVRAGAAAGGAGAALIATALSAGASRIGMVAQDDDTKRSTSWSQDASDGYTVANPSGVDSHGAALPSLLEQIVSKPEKPVMSLSAIVNRVEDAMAVGGLLAGTHPIMVVDQETEKVSLFDHDPSDEIDLSSLAAVKFDQELVTASDIANQAFE